MGVDVIRNNFQLVILFLIWLIAGVVAGPSVYLLIPLTVLLLFANNKVPEIFFGFIFILVLSDSLEAPLAFAKGFKNVYILLYAFLILLSVSKINHTVKIYTYFIPYFILALIGMFYSPVMFTSMQKLLSYILLFIAVPNYVSYCYQTGGSVFFRNLLYFMLALIVVGFMIRFIWPEVAFSHGGRLRGLFGNPNGFGIFMVVFFLLFSTVKLLYPYLFSKQENIIFLLVILYITYKTGSRASLMAIVIYYFFVWVFTFSSVFGFILFFTILISSDAIIFYFPQLVVALGLEKVFRVETLEEGSGRTVAWDFAWQNIQQSYFIGKGIAFDEFLMRENRVVLSKAGHEGGVHNTYLIMWLNTGLIGLLMFLRGFISLFAKASKRYKEAFPIMFAIMFSINFEPWLSASLNPYTIIYLVIITLLTEEYFIEDEEDEEEEEFINEDGNLNEKETEVA